MTEFQVILLVTGSGLLFLFFIGIAWSGTFTKGKKSPSRGIIPPPPPAPRCPPSSGRPTYTLVEGTSRLAINAKVMAYIEKGWVPQGGISCLTAEGLFKSSPKKFLYLQAMVTTRNPPEFLKEPMTPAKFEEQFGQNPSPEVGCDGMEGSHGGS